MTLVNTEIAGKYQKFFNFMNQEHGLVLTQEEMDEIVFEAQRLVKEFDSIPIVSDSVCPNCDGYGYTVDENGRRKEHCDKC